MKKTILTTIIGGSILLFPGVAFAHGGGQGCDCKHYETTTTIPEVTTTTVAPTTTTIVPPTTVPETTPTTEIGTATTTLTPTTTVTPTTEIGTATTTVTPGPSPKLPETGNHGGLIPLGVGLVTVGTLGALAKKRV